MKIYNIIFIVAITAGFVISSCKTDEIEVPVACCEAYVELEDGTLQARETFEVGQEIVFKSCSEADQYAIWTGDTGHNYDANHGGPDANRGLAFETDDGTFYYSYSETGTYKVVFFATNTIYAKDSKQAMKSFNITVIDPIGEE